MESTYMARWFWIYLAILVVAYGVLSSTASLNDFIALKRSIAEEGDFNQFFDCELLTNPTWIGFQNTFLSGFFLNPESMKFEPHDPLLKVNYSQAMAELLIDHATIPYLIGSLCGTGVTLFLMGGVLAILFLKIQRKECKND